tara:strand:- start:381 stop:767 length:387 start_codon:yes stop_codon:yes gene_type:complete
MIKYLSLLVFVFYVSCGSMSWGQDLTKLHKMFEEGEVANAQKPIVCQHPDYVVKVLTDEWGEQPIMTWNNVSVRENGMLMKTTIAFGLNKETGTWSLVEFIDEDWACFVGNGWGLEIFSDSGEKLFKF